MASQIEQIRKLENRIAKEKAKLKMMRSKVAAAQRKKETRVKIILGSIVLKTEGKRLPELLDTWHQKKKISDRDYEFIREFMGIHS